MKEQKNKLLMEDKQENHIYLCCVAGAILQVTCPLQQVCYQTQPSELCFLPPDVPVLSLEQSKIAHYNPTKTVNTA